jgi:hypothetical protein
MAMPIFTMYFGHLCSVVSMDRIRKHRQFLRSLVDKRNNPIKAVKQASDPELCAICELVKNIIHNPTLKVGDQERELLRKHKKQLRALINRHVPKGKKRSILQRGGNVLLPLIISLIGPLISRLIQ